MCACLHGPTALACHTPSCSSPSGSWSRKRPRAPAYSRPGPHPSSPGSCCDDSVEKPLANTTQTRLLDSWEMKSLVFLFVFFCRKGVWANGGIVLDCLFFVSYTCGTVYSLCKAHACVWPYPGKRWRQMTDGSPHSCTKVIEAGSKVVVTTVPQTRTWSLFTSAWSLLIRQRETMRNWTTTFSPPKRRRS